MVVARLQICAFVAAWLIPLAGTLPQPLAAQTGALSADNHRAIQVLASAVTGQPDRTDQIFSEMGFPSEQARARWNGFEQWPSLRKIEMGYFAAIEANGPQGGADFLRTMTRIAAADHSRAIRYEKALAGYFPEAPSATIAVADRRATRFVLPASIPAAAPPPEVRAVVTILEKHVGRVPGGLQGLISRCCNHSPDAVYEIIRNASSPSEALFKALETGKIPPELLERLKRLARVSVDSSRALASEPALADLLEPTGARTRSPRPQAVREAVNASATALAKQAMLAANVEQSRVDWAFNSNGLDDSPSATDGGGGLGDGGGGNAQRYSRVRESIGGGGPSSSGRPSFRAARASGGGFGGVVFGNDLNISGIIALRSLDWVADTTANEDGIYWGRFEVLLANGEIVPTRRMRQEDAAIANAIVFDPSQPLNVAGGEAVGLSGVDNEAETRIAKARPFVVHPLLFGTSLADAAILADARMFMTKREAFESRLQRAKIPQDAVAKALAWHDGDWGFYKITDAPLSVVSRDGMITVERTKGTIEASDALRRTSLLAFQACAYNELAKEDECNLPESQTTFYAASPGLMAAFPEFDRLNGFAEAFALLRWAGSARATVRAPGEPKRQLQRLWAVRHDDGDIGLIANPREFGGPYHDCERSPENAAAQHGLEIRKAADPDELCQLLVAIDIVADSSLNRKEIRETLSLLYQKVAPYVVSSPASPGPN